MKKGRTDRIIDKLLVDYKRNYGPLTHDFRNFISQIRSGQEGVLHDWYNAPHPMLQRLTALGCAAITVPGGFSTHGPSEARGTFTTIYAPESRPEYLIAILNRG